MMAVTVAETKYRSFDCGCSLTGTTFAPGDTSVISRNRGGSGSKCGSQLVAVRQLAQGTLFRLLVLYDGRLLI